MINYTEAHPYFKKYFDKPPKRTPYNRFREMDLQFRGASNSGSQVFYQGSPPRYTLAQNQQATNRTNRRQIPMYESTGAGSDEYNQSPINVGRQGAKWASPSKNAQPTNNVSDS